MNAVSTQRPASSATAPSSKATPQTTAPQPQPPPQQAPQSIAAAAPAAGLKDEAMSRSDSGDGSALPTTASWAKNPQIEQSRRSSQAASRSTSSPRSTSVKPAPQRSESRVVHQTGYSTTESRSQSIGEEASKHGPKLTAPTVPVNSRPSLARLEAAVKTVISSSFSWSLDRNLYDAETLNVIDNYPMLIDINGGAVRYAMKAQEEQQRLKQEEERNIMQAISAADDDDNLASGSLQLGGEPETQDDQGDGQTQFGQSRGSLSQRGFRDTSASSQPFDSQVSIGNEFSNLSITGRSLTPQQQRNMSILKSNNQQHDPMLAQFQRGPTANTSLHQPQLSNPFQAHNQQLSGIPGHARQISRFNFAKDATTASAPVKPAMNPQMMTQQAAMLPPNQAKHFSAQASQQPNLHTNFYSGIQGPPPGLRSSGTPPISGGGMFGQGHGFAASAMSTGIGFNGNLGSKNSNDDLMQSMIRAKGVGGNGHGSEVGKREFIFPSLLQKPKTFVTPYPDHLGSLYGSQLDNLHGHQDATLKHKKRKKHRHADTSSSGGGGIVDLADPSILQARMHHAGAGQGLYGGAQGQGGYSSHNAMYGGGFGGRW